MIQTYQNLYSQVNLINKQFDGQVFIQKIYSSAYFIAMNLRVIGKTYQFYIGRGNGHEGIWLDEYPLESFLRKRDVFLEYLRKHLAGSTLIKIDMDKKDRIVSIYYQKWGRENIFSFFYRGRELLFSNYYYEPKKDEMAFFRSWKKEQVFIQEFSYDFFDEIGRTQLDQKVEKKIISIKTLIQNELKQAQKSKRPIQKNKFLERKLRKIEQDLEKVKETKNIQDLINQESNLADLPLKIDINGVKIKFKEKSHFKRRDELYNKIKSLNKAKKILEIRLKDTKEQLDSSETLEYKNELKVNKVYWKQESNLEKNDGNIKSHNQNYTLISFHDLKIAVGENAAGNDFIRSKWANKDDYWFHIDGDRSAHLIVKGNSISFNKDLIDLIGSIILDFSQVNYSEVDLVYTQVKNLKGVKNSPGKVIFKKEKRVRAQKITDWHLLTHS